MEMKSFTEACFLKITYCEAINQALRQEMARDPTVFVYGISIASHSRVFGTTANLAEMFGSRRCFETPVCEEMMLGFGLGAAINGLRPVHVHLRVDFLLLAMNQLVNMVSTYNYAAGGKVKIPLVIRAVVGRGWGQGFQHSKSLHSYFAHIPGLKVVLPTTPYDVKGLLISSIRDNNPVVFIEHRWLYWAEADVPEESYTIPLGKANVLKEGKDITVVATSWMNIEALKAAEVLQRKTGVDVEVIDPRTIAPLDEETIIRSVKKTGHCLVVDNDWVSCGFGAEAAAMVAEKCFDYLQSPVKRLGWSHTPCPTVRSLENTFYSNAQNIIRSIESMLKQSPLDLSGEEFYSHEKHFKGPF
jgi:pyruvate/2-oxoglutarate/acetoin dehydrogenase E1 component